MDNIFAELRGLSPDQRELMLRMLEKEGVDLARLPVPRRTHADRAPLSATQERLWAIHQLSAGQPTENVPVAIELEGRLDAEALSASINYLVARHEILRTTFQQVSDLAEQRIHPFSEFKLEIIDLASADCPPTDAEVESELVRHASRLFNPETDWLMRPVLLRLSAHSHILLLTFHQLTVDGWAVNVIMQELTAVYAAYRDGLLPGLTDTEVQYADLAEWQREGWEDQLIAGQIDYWVNKLRDAPVLLDLPTGRPRPAMPAFTGALALMELPEAPVAELRQLAKIEGVTMFTAVLAALKFLLASYSGQQDVVVGTLTSRRGRVEAENMVGNFGNNLLLRSEIDTTSSFREILHVVNETSLDAMANQDAPLDLVNAELHRRSGQRIPAFQIGFIFRDGGLHDRLEMPGLEIKQRFVDLGTARLDMWLDLADHGATLSGEIQYRTDLFDASQIDSLLHHWEIAVTQLTRFPDLPVSEINIFSAADGLTASRGRRMQGLLEQHPSLSTAVVAAPGPLVGGPANIRFVRAGLADVTGTELREWLEARLDFDIGPALFTEVDSLASEPAFAAMTQNILQDEVVYESELEGQIASIWSDVLGVNPVLPGDNFFDIGGHSLLAVQALKTMQTLGGFPPDPKSLVTGTLRQLAVQMDDSVQSAAVAGQEKGNTMPGKRSLLGRLVTRLN